MKKFQVIPIGLLALILSACSSGGYTWKTDSLEVRINQRGYVDKLVNLSEGTNYAPKTKPSPLMQIRVDGQYYSPTGCELRETDQKYLLHFDEAKVVAVVSIRNYPDYIRFQLDEMIPADGIELVVWGPIQTSISETIGEIVGVVRNQDFAIGIQALNIRTLGGYPDEENDQDKAYDIFESNSVVDVADSVTVLYRGQTAKRTDEGSVLQAYVRDRSTTRVIPNWNHQQYLVPAFADEGIIGSAIAIFGCAPDEALPIIGKIELAENLPHPIIDGAWGKMQRTATASYLIMNFGEKTLENALDLTTKAGLKYLYHGGPFANWGHFDLNTAGFPDNWESMRRCVDRAEARGIRLGVHTLSNFISTNDPYVTPIPDQRLAKVGSSRITQEVGASNQYISIESPDFFNQMKNNTLQAVVVNDEIIRYQEVTATEPWMLLDCERGAFGTSPSAHQAGDTISKLMDHGYKTFLTNADLSQEVALRLAEFYNQTGLRQISFDGLEGNWSTGMGQYARQLFVQYWYDALKPELKGTVITDASNPGHFFWHSFTRMNWGEPWYAGFRESQTQYRLLNQDFYRRNLMPAMLGWFRMTPEISLEDIEWLLARSAGFDAGFALVTNPEVVAMHGFGEQIMKTISIWEEARMAGVFPDKIKPDLQNIHKEFHLEKSGPNKWNLYRVNQVKGTLDLVKKQSGEHNLLQINFKNENPDQPVSFIISAPKETGITQIQIGIDSIRKVLLPLDIPANHHIRYTGGSYISLYDAHWNKIASARMIQDHLMLHQGDHTLTIEADAGTESGSAQVEFRTLAIPEILIKQL